ncbi:sequence-specific DNA binding [Ascochyta rabiei]|uniref:Sequence-specific DNA binding n=1 Tax=Didymella rabiei TaxID=5454 RepID=A0A163LMN6_DIDRA|nr:sequence-specific DNA binding [Ascochyta rabiei]
MYSTSNTGIGFDLDVEFNPFSNLDFDNTLGLQGNTTFSTPFHTADTGIVQEADVQRSIFDALHSTEYSFESPPPKLILRRNPGEQPFSRSLLHHQVDRYPAASARMLPFGIWGSAAANGSPSDKHTSSLLHNRPLSAMSSDYQGIAALTPPADHHSGAGSPADYSSPQYFQSPAAEPARRPSNGRTCGHGSTYTRATADSLRALHGRGSTALVPLPALCTATSPSTIATTSSTSSSGGPCTPAAGGPLARNYAIPPRPKPGRKPATDEPASKRKAQNRESQRAFRARKAAKVTELAEQVEEMQKQHNLEKNELLNEINSLAKRLHDAERAFDEQVKFTKHAEEDRDYWKEQHDSVLRNQQSDSAPINRQINGRNDATATLYQPAASNGHRSPAHHSVSSFHGFGTPISDDVAGGCGDCKPGDCACINKMAEDMKDIDSAFDAPYMPAVPLPRRSGRPTNSGDPALLSDSSDDLEMDFTATFARPSTALLDEDQKLHDSCGFCENGGHCVCRDAREKLQAEAELAPLSRMSSDVSAQNKKIAPGGCADCQTDPARRAWCLRVAQLREDGHRSRRNSGPRSPQSLDTLEPPVVSKIDMNISRASPIPGKRSVGCSETFRLLDGRIPMDDPSAWSNLRPMLSDGRRDTFTMEPRVYSAMEIDAADIITTMQNSRGPLKPRPEDGEYAPLVTAAEERRRATNSPANFPKGEQPTPMEL